MRRHQQRLFFVLLMSRLVLSESEIDGDACTTQVCENEAENILSKLDLDVDPCEDFYRFACGNFINETEIPDDKTSVGVFSDLSDKLDEQLSEILNSSITSSDIHPFACVKKLYKACVNEELIDTRGLKPIKAVLESLGGWPVLEGKNWAENTWFWQKLLLKLELGGFNSNYLFTVSIDVDLKNTSKRIISLDQPSLGIEREYLINGFDDEIVQAYYNYHVDTAVLYGADRFYAEMEVKRVLNFEMDLAKLLTPKEERRNMTLMYQPVTIKHFQPTFPIHDWFKFLSEMMSKENKIKEDEEIMLTDFKFIVENVYELLKKTPNRVIVNYLMWRTASSMAIYLNKDVRDRFLEFSKVLMGMKSSELRWRQCVDIVSESLPIATSALYVKNFFKKESRDVALQLVDSIREEFQEMLKSVDWMDEATREAALKKAEKMTAHIGFPDELMDDKLLIKYYDNLTIDEDRFFESIVNIEKFDMNQEIKKFRQAVNKSDWESHASVAMVNAFFNPVENSIQFPAGILQGAFFNADRPRYMNYASIGSVIGHEITHGFDDEGSQFDGDGNLADWWEKHTKEAFLEKAQCIIDQYGNFTDQNVELELNGINTQGENIADNGGMKVAYRAYMKWVEKNGAEAKLPNLNNTSGQLFWISAAQTWCSVSRPEALKQQITVDPHSPDEFRVIGPLSNLKEFSKEFQCQEGSAMSPEQKCDVW